MNGKLSFSFIGLIVFVLPMLINVVYAFFPPVGEAAVPKHTTRWVEVVETVSRIAYLLLLTFWVNQEPLRPRSAWLIAAAVCLILYYLVWIRYFAGGRKVAWLGKPFLFVPLPLAVFPVLYYLFAAIWMGNFPAAFMMGIFGAAHITVSVQSFR